MIGRYRSMELIRAFENRVQSRYRAGRVPELTHFCIGQGAVAAGVCGALEPQDCIARTHRGHGHTLARGSVPDRLMAEILGKATGYVAGRGGSTNVFDVANAKFGANGIVGGAVLLGLEAALVARQGGLWWPFLAMGDESGCGVGVFQHGRALEATPPVGFNLSVLRSVVPGATMSEVTRDALIFVLPMLAGIVQLFLVVSWRWPCCPTVYAKFTGDMMTQRFTADDVRLEAWCQGPLFVASTAAATANKAALEAHFLAEWNDDIDATIATMDPEGPWPRIPALGVYVSGYDAVRDYYLVRFADWTGPVMERFDRVSFADHAIFVKGC
jgi:hypothetical protein